MVHVIGEGGERLCCVDLYWIFGDILIEQRRKVLGLPDPASLREDPVWQSYCVLQREFEQLFRGLFSDWRDWSDCFNSDSGIEEWWKWFKTTSIYSKSQVIIEELRQFLLNQGVDQSELEPHNLLRRSLELDQVWANMWVAKGKQADLLCEPYGWLELHLILLTLPPDLEESDPLEISELLDLNAEDNL